LPTAEEISAWSIDEALAEIQALLPKDSYVTSVPNSDGYWVVMVERPTPDGPVVDMSESNLDRRIATLNLFGQVWLKNAPQPPPGSPWVRRNELTREVVTRRVAQNIPDPEDLNPSEVEAVYRKGPT
jgi:hypothetical protein